MVPRDRVSAGAAAHCTVAVVNQNGHTLGFFEFGHRGLDLIGLPQDNLRRQPAAGIVASVLCDQHNALDAVRHETVQQVHDGSATDRLLAACVRDDAIVEDTEGHGLMGRYRKADILQARME